MSAMTPEEIYYDAALRPCPYLHECRRCHAPWEHDIDTRYCELVDTPEAILCMTCREETEDCLPGCGFLEDDKQEHSYVCWRVNALARGEI